MAKFATYASGDMLLLNLIQVAESISGSVVPLAMFRKRSINSACISLFTKVDDNHALVLEEGNTTKASFNCALSVLSTVCSPSRSIHLKSSSIELSPLLRLKCLR